MLLFFGNQITQNYLSLGKESLTTEEYFPAARLRFYSLGRQPKLLLHHMIPGASYIDQSVTDS